MDLLTYLACCPYSFTFFAPIYKQVAFPTCVSYYFYRRPGVLVLVNDADWELSGLDESPLADGDRVAFISTLHGG